MDVVLYEQSNQTIFVMEAQHHRLIHALLAQLDYRQMLQKHRVLQLAETANERVLKLAMAEIRQVETDVVQAVLLKLEQSEMEELHHHLMYAIFALQVFTPNTGSTICEPHCGDSKRTGSETCDDGNTNDGDGCSSLCVIESNFI